VLVSTISAPPPRSMRGGCAGSRRGGSGRVSFASPRTAARRNRPRRATGPGIMVPIAPSSTKNPLIEQRVEQSLLSREFAHHGRTVAAERGEDKVRPTGCCYFRQLASVVLSQAHAGRGVWRTRTRPGSDVAVPLLDLGLELSEISRSSSMMSSMNSRSAPVLRVKACGISDSISCRLHCGVV